MTNEERSQKIANIRKKINEIYELADELDLGNIFYNEGFLELFLAEDLGHTWNKKTQGADAFDEVGHPVEYKMRSNEDGSFQFHWLSDNKMEKLKSNERVYFATRNRTDFWEVYSIEMELILPTLNESRKSAGGSGHRTYSLQQLLDMGAVRVR